MESGPVVHSQRVVDLDVVAVERNGGRQSWQLKLSIDCEEGFYTLTTCVTGGLVKAPLNFHDVQFFLNFPDGVGFAYL